jgi:hypothetical protein
MISAFGVDHGSISKAADTVPDWASGAIPASTAVAYNKTRRNRVKAATHNFGFQTAGSVLGGAAGIGLGALALKSKRVPKFLTSTTTKKLPFGRSVTINADHKKGFAASTVSGITGGVAGGYAGQKHLQHLKKDPEYKYKES